MEESNSVAVPKKVTGNAKIDQQIGEWLRLDKVNLSIKKDMYKYINIHIV